MNFLQASAIASHHRATALSSDAPLSGPLRTLEILTDIRHMLACATTKAEVRQAWDFAGTRAIRDELSAEFAGAQGRATA